MFCNNSVALPNCLVDVCLGKVDLVFVLLLIFCKLGALEVGPGGILNGFFLLVKAYWVICLHFRLGLGTVGVFKEIDDDCILGTHLIRSQICIHFQVFAIIMALMARWTQKRANFCSFSFWNCILEALPLAEA